MNPALDRDYGVLCGHPQVRRIYHTGRWIYVTVAVTDIGRANQPAPCGIDACAAVERMPPGDARAKEKMRRRPQRSLDEHLQAVLGYHFGSASIKLLANRLHMPPETVQAHVAANPELYEMFPGGRGSVRVRMRGRQEPGWHLLRLIDGRTVRMTPEEFAADWTPTDAVWTDDDLNDLD